MNDLDVTTYYCVSCETHLDVDLLHRTTDDAEYANSDGLFYSGNGYYHICDYPIGDELANPTEGITTASIRRGPCGPLHNARIQYDDDPIEFEE